MYLANDVIQNSKKKGPEFGKEFGNVLRKCFEDIVKHGCDEKTRNSLNRILAIWEERGVYDSRQIEDFRKGFGKCLYRAFTVLFLVVVLFFLQLFLFMSAGEIDEDSPPFKKKYQPALVETNSATHISPGSTPGVNHSKSPLRKRKFSETEFDHDGTKDIVVHLSPRTPAREPPEPEELIQALMVSTFASKLFHYITCPIYLC